MPLLLLLLTILASCRSAPPPKAPPPRPVTHELPPTSVTPGERKHERTATVHVYVESPVGVEDWKFSRLRLDVDGACSDEPITLLVLDARRAYASFELCRASFRVTPIESQLPVYFARSAIQPLRELADGETQVRVDLKLRPLFEL